MGIIEMIERKFPERSDLLLAGLRPGSLTAPGPAANLQYQILIKSFREPVVNIRQDLVRPGALTLLLPQPAQAGSSPQLVGAGMLAAGNLQRFLKTDLGFALLSPFCQYQLPLVCLPLLSQRPTMEYMAMGNPIGDQLLDGIGDRSPRLIQSQSYLTTPLMEH